MATPDNPARAAKLEVANGLSHSVPTNTAVPLQAAIAGYNTQTLNSPLTSSCVDVTDSRVPGFNWYLGSWYATNQHTASSSLTFNSDSSMTLNPLSGGGAINTTAPFKDNSNWVGTAFGGGAYVEATFKFDPSQVQNNWTGASFPAWWTNTLEAQIGSTLSGSYAGNPSRTSFWWQSQQTATPGFAHFIEPDIFEYDYSTVQSPPAYQGTLHDWSGVYSGGWPVNITQPSGPTKTPPASTDFRLYHSYGLLWIPATLSKSGLLRYYFDGMPIGTDVTYAQYSDSSDTPPVTSSSPWLFGVIDQQHLCLTFNTSSGMPMTISNVSVWQKDTSSNLTN